MADKLKDAEDRFLESMFRAEPIADDGFSSRVVRRIRRRIWIRRLALPLALLIGGAISVEPALQLIEVGSTLLSIVPQDFIEIPAVSIPQLPILLLGGALLVIAMLSVRMLEE